MAGVEPSHNGQFERRDADLVESASTGNAAFVDHALRGDAAALEELLARSEPTLRQALNGHITPQFRAALDVDDVIQVTFIEAFLRIGQFTTNTGPGSFMAWLTTLARNNLRDALKALRAEKRIPRHKMVAIGGSADSYGGLLANLAGSSTTPSRAAGRIEAKALVESALAKLPPDYEKVIRAMDLDGKTGPQTATELGRSVGAVYMLQIRARAHLRELLGESADFFSSGS